MLLCPVSSAPKYCNLNALSITTAEPALWPLQTPNIYSFPAVQNRENGWQLTRCRSQQSKAAANSKQRCSSFKTDWQKSELRCANLTPTSGGKPAYVQRSWEPSAVLKACTTTPKQVLSASRRHIPTRLLVSLRWMIAFNSLPHLHKAQQNTLYKKYQRSNYRCSNSLLFIKHKCPISYTSTLWTAFWCGATPVGLFPTDTHCIPHTVKMSEGRVAFALGLYTWHPRATLLARALPWLFTRASWSLQEQLLFETHPRRDGVTLQTADAGLRPTMLPSSLNPHCLNCTASVTSKPPAVKVCKKKKKTNYSSCLHSPQYFCGEHQLAQFANKVT